MGDKIKDLWGLDSPILNFFKKIGWAFLLNILFIITSIPIVTVGASATAMYTVFFKIIDERDFSFFGDYFRAWIRNFGKATVVWMIVLLAVVISGIDIWYVFTGMTGAFGFIMKCGTIVLAVAICIFANILFPMITLFDLTWKELFVSAYQMIAGNILLGIESVVFTLVIFGGSYLIIYSGFLWGFFILFPMLACGLHGLMQSYLCRHMFGLDVEDEESDVNEEIE